MKEMTFTRQLPNLCAFACLESILVDKGTREIDQTTLFKLGGCSTNLLEAYKNINAHLGLNIQQGPEVGGKNPETSHVCANNSGKEILVIVMKKSDNNPVPWPNHALRIKESAGKILVMDPCLPKSPSENIFPGLTRREDYLIETDTQTLDLMRKNPNGTTLEYFFV